MKIIKKGKIERKLYVRTCTECGTKFEYGYNDIESDRQGSYVVCPLEECNTIITHHPNPNTLDKGLLTEDH